MAKWTPSLHPRDRFGRWRAKTARAQLARRRKYDRQEMRYNKEMARRRSPNRDLSNFDYLSKGQRLKENQKQAKLALRGRKVS